MNVGLQPTECVFNSARWQMTSFRCPKNGLDFLKCVMLTPVVTRFHLHVAVHNVVNDCFHQLCFGHCAPINGFRNTSIRKTAQHCFHSPKPPERLCTGCVGVGRWSDINCSRILIRIKREPDNNGVPVDRGTRCEGRTWPSPP